MTPPTPLEDRRRPHHACLNCRRKKTRCPGEKPACSSCVRLKQHCSYPPVAKAPQGSRSDNRLSHLEDRLDFALNGNAPRQGTHDENALDDVNDVSEMSYSTASPPKQPEPSFSSRPSSVKSISELSTRRPSFTTTAKAIGLYFEYCHRQPIWCFDRGEVEDQDRLPDELVWSIMALTSRFSQDRDQSQHYDGNAKSLIMLRIANGTVDVSTIESLCLLSYAYFIDGDWQLGRFHVGLAFQLCRSAMLDLEPVYVSEDPITERKKRLFWSLQLLEQSYGRQTGLRSIPTEIWRPSFSDDQYEGSQRESDPKPPPLPRDILRWPNSVDAGIWSVTVHLGWVWSRVREYVSDCARNRLKEPWRHDSMYALVSSDFMETEHRIPMCHRYDEVKFWERRVEELRNNRDYWIPWLKDQFTYHSIPAVLNHPFLYIVASQYNNNLAIPNTFWKRSSEQGLHHSTWITRMIDMVTDKKVRLIDPFYGHAAAIAATVHLYYCCAADSRLRHKSNTDLNKCRKFLKSFVSFSRACEALDQNIDKLIRIASGSDSMNVDDWIPSKIHLSVPLMWDILQFNCALESQERRTDGLLHPSLNPIVAPGDTEESSTLEIIVTTSPEVTVNTADGGQTAPASSYKPLPTPSATRRDATPNTVSSDITQWVAPIDNLMTNTPWLWANPSQFMDIGDVNNLGFLG